MDYTLGVIALCAILAVLAYLDRIYRELGRVTTGRLHEHLDIFEAEIEPRLRLKRRHAALALFHPLAPVLACVAVETARGVLRVCARRRRGVRAAPGLRAWSKFCSSRSSFPNYFWRAPPGAGSSRWFLHCGSRCWRSGRCERVLELAISVAHISEEEPRSAGPRPSRKASKRWWKRPRKRAFSPETRRN